MSEEHDDDCECEARSPAWMVAGDVAPVEPFDFSPDLYATAPTARVGVLTAEAVLRARDAFRAAYVSEGPLCVHPVGNVIQVLWVQGQTAGVVIQCSACGELREAELTGSIVAGLQVSRPAPAAHEPGCPCGPCCMGVAAAAGAPVGLRVHAAPTAREVLERLAAERPAGELVVEALGRNMVGLTLRRDGKEVRGIVDLEVLETAKHGGLADYEKALRAKIARLEASL